MATSIAEYAETPLIQTIQDLYTSELNLPSNVFDSDGRINVVQPSNMTPICAELIREQAKGISACKESDRQGALLLHNVLIGEEGYDCKIIKRFGSVKATFRDSFCSCPAIGVVYSCAAGLIDCAIPVLDPMYPGSSRMLSIIYVGQYLDVKESLNKSVKVICENVSRLLTSSKQSDQIEKILHCYPRPAQWHEINVATHVVYALGNATAQVAYKSWNKNGNRKLTYSRKNLLEIYFEAFHILSNCTNGCILHNNKWTGTFDPIVKCEGYVEARCDRNVGYVFNTLRMNSAVDFLREDDQTVNPWQIGEAWVRRNYAFAVRGRRDGLLAVVNLNLDEGTSVPSEICFEAMKHLARQMGAFIESENSLRHFHRLIDLWKEVDQVAREYPANTRLLCAEAAKALSTKAEGHNTRPTCLVWLVDRVDDSESQYRGDESSTLTCYAIGHNYPSDMDLTFKKDDAEQIVDITPIDWESMKEVVKKVILTPSELKKTYSDLGNSRAFDKAYVKLSDENDHMMVLPILGRDENDIENAAGFLIVIDSLKSYLTEEERQLYMSLCHRLFDALQLVTLRSRLEIESKVHDHQRDLLDCFGVTDRKDRLKKYIQQVTQDIRNVTEVEGVSVFLRNDYPDMDCDKNPPIKLWASSNLRNGGSSCIYDIVNKIDIGENEYHKVTYKAREGCTGFAMYKEGDVFRISDLKRHSEAILNGEATGPKWQERYLELRDPGFGRRGIICTKLKDRTGAAIGLLRASSRQDGLRFTRFDEDALSAVASVLAREISICTYEDKLGLRGQSLAAMSEAIRIILQLNPFLESYASCLLQTVMLPVIVPGGIGMGRVAYCEIRDGTVITAPFVLGGRTQNENVRIKELAQRTFSNVREPNKGHHLIEDEYHGLLQELRKNGMDFVRDHFEVFFDQEGYDTSVLSQALKCRTYRIVENDSGINALDRDVFQAFQGNLESQSSFAYIPIKGIFGSKGIPRAFLYVDSPFPDNEIITSDLVQSLWTFASILGGMWSAARLREESKEKAQKISHEIANLLAGVVAEHKLLSQNPNLQLRLESTYYRVSAVLTASDSSKRGRLPEDLDQKVNLDEAFKRLRSLYNEDAFDYGLKTKDGEGVIIPSNPSNFIVKGNRSYLDTVLGQLLDNSLKQLSRMVPKKGLRQCGFIDPKEVVISGGKYVMVGVWDTGPGIPDEVVVDLSDRPYNELDGVRGIGIGLATCRMLLDIWVKELPNKLVWRKREGGGTEFNVWLPLVTTVTTDRKKEPE